MSEQAPEQTTPDQTAPPEQAAPEEEEALVTETVTVRYLTNRGGDVAEHILEAANPGVQNMPEPDLPDPATLPQTAGMGADYSYQPGHDTTQHEMDTSGLHDKEVPRHDKYASENTGDNPDRILPGGITNAHPDFTVGDAMPAAEAPEPAAPVGIEDGKSVPAAAPEQDPTPPVAGTAPEPSDTPIGDAAQAATEAPPADAPAEQPPADAAPAGG
jgi:hypothetical protein